MLLINCFFIVPIVYWDYLFGHCFAIQYFVSVYFCNHLDGKRDGCLVTVSVLWLFLTVSWVGVRCVIVVCPDHTHLPYNVLTSIGIF